MPSRSTPFYGQGSHMVSSLKGNPEEKLFDAVHTDRYILNFLSPTTSNIHLCENMM